MGLNFIEKQVLKHHWSNTMKKFKTWAPIVGVIFLAVHTLAHEVGWHKADASLSTVAATIPIEEQSPIPKSDIADAIAKTLAAIAALGGVARKVKALILAAQAVSELVPGETVNLKTDGEKVGEAVVTKITPVLLLALLPSLALAQDPPQAPEKDFNVFAYLAQHASVATGVLDTDAESYKIVEVRLRDAFQLADKWRGAYRLSLFSMARAGEQAPSVPTLPTTLEQLKAYSDGELWVSVQRELRQGIDAECIGGFTFKMISITGQIGDPLDGTKAAAACGFRFSYRGHAVSVLGGHYGPVAENGKLLGFVPNLIVYANIPLKFLGDGTAFVPDLAFGAIKPSPSDPDPRYTVSKSLKLLVSTRF